MSELDRLARRLARPAGEDLGRAQGTIRSWDAATFSNVIEVDGLLIEDVPVASGLEALTYAPGQVVMLETWFPGGKLGERGLGTPWITGRVITPGAGAADQVIAALRTELARSIMDELVEELLVSPAGQDLAAFVISSRDKFASEDASATRGSATYGTLTGGPVVTDVPVSESGIMVVGVQAMISVTNSDGDNRVGHMSYSISGATTRTALDANSFMFASMHSNTSNVDSGASKAMAFSVQTGLNPGLHTVTAQYRALTTSGTVTFANRRLRALGY